MMPKDKDFKRLVRERMAKTGESYTAARLQILAKRSQSGERLSEDELVELAGRSTASVVRATGHGWGWWLEHLNEAGLSRAEHRELTRYVGDRFDISAWWIQSLVIGYERIVGLREIGQRREGTYDANKSKTFPVPVTTLYRAFADDHRRQAWLADIDWRVRTQTEPKSIRLEWPDGSPVSLWFTAKAEEKSTVQIQHGRLASKDEIGPIKEAWTARFKKLSAFFDAG